MAHNSSKVILPLSVYKVAQARLRKIAKQATNFKVGETGQTIDNRHKRSDYNSVYQHNSKIYSSKNKKLIDLLEEKLINYSMRYYASKCDNLSDKSHNTMTDVNGIYHIYIVYNT